MRRKLRYYIHGIKNMWRWRKVLFSDQDWDYWYIYNILKTKLEFTAEHIERYGVHENRATDVAQIREVVRLLDIVQNEKIIDEAFGDDNWTEERFREIEKRHAEAKQELFKKLHDNIDNWWD
jgi:hypothetical protein